MAIQHHQVAARIFWQALDRAAGALTLTRLRLVDLIYGPEPPTPADEKREADRERLQRAFSAADIEPADPTPSPWGR